MRDKNTVISDLNAPFKCNFAKRSFVGEKEEGELFSYYFVYGVNHDTAHGDLQEISFCCLTSFNVIICKLMMVDFLGNF